MAGTAPLVCCPWPGSGRDALALRRQAARHRTRPLPFRAMMCSKTLASHCAGQQRNCALMALRRGRSGAAPVVRRGARRTRRVPVQATLRAAPHCTTLPSAGRNRQQREQAADLHTHWHAHRHAPTSTLAVHGPCRGGSTLAPRTRPAGRKPAPCWPRLPPAPAPSRSAAGGAACVTCGMRHAAFDTRCDRPQHVTSPPRALRSARLWSHRPAELRAHPHLAPFRVPPARPPRTSRLTLPTMNNTSPTPRCPAPSLRPPARLLSRTTL